MPTGQTGCAAQGCSRAAADFVNVAGPDDQAVATAVCLEHLALVRDDLERWRWDGVRLLTREDAGAE